MVNSLPKFLKKDKELKSKIALHKLSIPKPGVDHIIINRTKGIR